jgi:hypothetical protein
MMEKRVMYRSNHLNIDEIGYRLNLIYKRLNKGRTKKMKMSIIWKLQIFEANRKENAVHLDMKEKTENINIHKMAENKLIILKEMLTMVFIAFIVVSQGISRVISSR